jgi:hypothetical protein
MAVRPNSAAISWHGRDSSKSARKPRVRQRTDRTRARTAPAVALEGLWSSLKAVELGQPGHALSEVIEQAHRGIDRVSGTPHLAYSFLRHAGLSVS